MLASFSKNSYVFMLTYLEDWRYTAERRILFKYYTAERPLTNQQPILAQRSQYQLRRWIAKFLAIASVL